VRGRGVQPEDADEGQVSDALAEAKRICTAEHVKVIEAGGLAVIGTERHDSRRIDNQLRGRSGRQGDPGVSQFYLSLEDDLMRLFGGERMDRISAFMERADIPEEMPIQAGMVSKAIESAQRQVEAMNFSARKHVLEYDDVMNKQREVIYAERQQVLDGKDIHGRVEEMMHDTIAGNVLVFCSERTYSEDWDWDGLVTWYRDLTGIEGAVEEFKGKVDNPHELAEALVEKALEVYGGKEAELGAEGLRDLERQVMLRILDTRWMDHLQEMDYLKEGIGLRAMGQRDPLVEYKSEAYEMFSGLVQSINEDFLRTVMHIQIVLEPEPEPSPLLRNVNYSSPSESTIFSQSSPIAQAAARSVSGPSPDAIAAASAAAGGGAKAATVIKDKDNPWENVGRNDPCPCGSGKKYKKCHGANA
jgi:preprotein translocase subunit SecA